MGRAIKAEFRKFFTTRMWWGMAIAMVIAGAAFAGLFGWMLTDQAQMGSEGAPTGTKEQIVNSVYTGGLSVGYLLTLTIGIMQIGSEYRHKTITSTFLSVPRRVKAMFAKVIALIGIGSFYGLLSLLGSVLVGAIVLNARGWDPFPTDGVWRTLGLSLLVLALWALIGLGVGILIPNQVAAILIAIGVAWIIEPLAGLLIGSLWDWGQEHVVKFLPSSATNAMVNGVTNPGMGSQLEWWGGALTLAAYAAVLAGLGIWRTTRRDIS
ncbi:ABC transporter permease [Actinomycetota bacterium]